MAATGDDDGNRYGDLPYDDVLDKDGNLETIVDIDDPSTWPEPLPKRA